MSPKILEIEDNELTLIFPASTEFAAILSAVTALVAILSALID